MGMKSKTKGKIGEREVAALLREFGFEGKRGQQFRGGAGSPDVEGLPGFHIEVKRCEAFQLYPALEQAEDDADLADTPVVFHRPNGRAWVAVLDARLFLKVVRHYRQLIENEG